MPLNMLGAYIATSDASYIEPEPCDHDWEYEDESFDHEFGTEVRWSRACRNCDIHEGCDPPNYELEEPEPDYEGERYAPR